MVDEKKFNIDFNVSDMDLLLRVFDCAVDTMVKEFDKSLPDILPLYFRLFCIRYRRDKIK